MSLSGSQRERLHEAICDAFDEESLTQWLRFAFNQRLGVNIPAGSLAQRVFQLIEDFEQRGHLDDLIRELAKERPNNQLVAAYLAKYPPEAKFGGSAPLG